MPLYNLRTLTCLVACQMFLGPSLSTEVPENQTNEPMTAAQQPVGVLDTAFHRAKCTSIHRYKIFENYMIVNKLNPVKDNLLREFLCIKYFQYLNLINSMSPDSKEDLDFKGKFAW